ncbi:unnamed protein product, partial [Symbiodinium sp. CCMP2456]
GSKATLAMASSLADVHADESGEDALALSSRKVNPKPRCWCRTTVLASTAALICAAGALGVWSCGWRRPGRLFLLQSGSGSLIGLSPLGPDAQKVVCTMDVAQMVSRVIQMSNAIYASTRNCDYDKIRRLKGRGPTSLEKEICTSSILIAMFNSQLLTGLFTSSVSSCTGNLHVPANCGTNIAAFVAAVLIILQGAIDIDISCAKDFHAPYDFEAKLLAKRARLERKKQRAVWSAQRAIKNAGVTVAELPAPPAVPSSTVYAAVSRCVSFTNLGTTQVVRLALVLAETSTECSPEESGRQPRVCAIDVMSILLGLSISMRAFSLAAIACVQVVGDFNPTAACVQACAGLSAGAFAFSARAMNVAPACSTAFERWDPEAWELARQGNVHPSSLEIP